MAQAPNLLCLPPPPITQGCVNFVITWVTKEKKVEKHQLQSVMIFKQTQ